MVAHLAVCSADRWAGYWDAQRAVYWGKSLAGRWVEHSAECWVASLVEQLAQ